VSQSAPERRFTPAKKSLGQNFLVDRGVLRKIVDAAALTKDDTVLEIGPGRGFLTEALAQAAGKVVAVELDDALAASITEKYADNPAFRVVVADAREVDIDSIIDRHTPYKMVANLPYYAASPIIRRFLEAAHKPAVMVVMVQREVAREMCAQPGEMGVLSVATQVYGTPKIVTYVPPGSFRPSPNVTSAVVKIEVYDSPAVPFDTPESFFRVVKAGFVAPRKQIHNNLRKGLDISPEEADAVLAKAVIDPKRRAETLSMDEWGKLYDAVRSAQ